jgi:phosphoenolpyruvate carboxylase
MARAHEEALREQFRLLGRIVGDTVAELRGAPALALVERTRQAAVALRAGRLPGGRAAFAEGFASLGLDELELLAESFTTLFHLVNAAEEQQRARALRARDVPGALNEGSVEAACAEIAGAGVSAREVQALLDRLLVMPVLTAHPTEARRRTLLDHLTEVATTLDALDDPRAGARERSLHEGRLREVVSALLATKPSRTTRPTPLDEVRAGLLVFEQTLLDVVPSVYRELARCLAARWPGESFHVGPFLRFGTWIGGDRDGNPFVTADVTRATLERQRAIALARHARDVTALLRDLSPSAATLPPSALAELERSIEEDRALGAAAPESTRTLRHDERWREKLRLVGARLEAARVRGEAGYADARGYLADLELLQRTLRAAGLARLAEGRLEDTRRRAEVFGFHLATLDVRQHSSVHERAVAEILAQGGVDGYAELDEPRRVALLAELAARPALAAPDRARLSPETREVLDTLEVVGRARRDVGPSACERYVVSFTSAASDLLEVVVLARSARLAADELRPVPLLEQLEDLEAAERIATEALAVPPLRAALGGELEVMVGYSDSGKQVGYVPSRVALHQAQLALARVAEAEGVLLTVFHGRGGVVGRGGGPANSAIRAQPRPALRGRFRVTEQGETIATRYGRAEIARRDLEQMLNAVLVASAGPVPPAAETAAREREADVAAAAAAALRSYRELLADPDRVARYALAATPMAEVPELRFASRPASRTGRITLDALRAIPWVFSWNQSRHGIPGWFGLGTALETLVAARGLEATRELYRDWPLVEGILDSARVALTQADVDVAACYAALAAPEDRGLFDLIREEHRRTVDAVRRVSGDEELMAPWPAAARAAERRNPYVDVLSHAQIELLARLRAAEGEERDRVREVLTLTINGIAAGLQTVG